MKCKKHKLIEMLLMARNDNEVVYQCPKCRDISVIKIETDEIEEEQ